MRSLLFVLLPFACLIHSAQARTPNDNASRDQLSRMDDEHAIAYALPLAKVAAGVSQRITHCPASAAAQAEGADEQPTIEFDFKVAIASKLAPRRLVALDSSSGFLVDRETKLHFSDDWYLKDFNGKTTGQGGPFVVSLIKAASAAFGMAASPITLPGTGVEMAQTMGESPPTYRASAWYLECRPEIVTALAGLEAARADIAAMEARQIAGDTSVALQDLLTRRRATASGLEGKLTVTVKTVLTPTFDAEGNATNLTGQIAAPDYATWFRVTKITRRVRSIALAGDRPERDIRDILAPVATEHPIPGFFGYSLTISPDAKLASWFGCNPNHPDAAQCAADVTRSDLLRTRDLVYLRPIPASAKLWPNPRTCEGQPTCQTDEDWPEADGASGSGDVKLPQLSRLFRLKTGGSIFGGRTVGAEFGALGEPTMLQYNVGSASKDVGSVIDAGVSSAQTMRDAGAAATKRRLDELKNARDLQSLLDELDAVE